MGLAERHAYRFGYLQSEHWKNLRIEKLAAEDAKCFVCGCRDISNDVHHVYYPKDLTTVQLSELRVLCRNHHQRIHELVEAEEKKRPKPGDENARKGYAFRNFRLAYEALLVEIDPLKSGQRSKKPQCKKVLFDTDKCPHTAKLKKMAKVAKSERLFWASAEKARRKMASMREVADMWNKIPESIKADIDESERLLKRLHFCLMEIRDKISP